MKVLLLAVVQRQERDHRDRGENRPRIARLQRIGGGLSEKGELCLENHRFMNMHIFWGDSKYLRTGGVGKNI